MSAIEKTIFSPEMTVEHPPAEGVFVPEEDLQRMEEQFADLDRGSRIKKLELIKSYETPDGRIDRYGMITMGGYAYAGFAGLPRNQTSDLGVAATSAWWTSTEGFNEHTARNVMRHGSPIAFLGAEGSYRPKEPVIPRQWIRLDRSAAATLRFRAVMSELYPDEFHETDTHIIGDSRGGMDGAGEASVLSEVFGLHVVSADLTAPCYPKRIQPKDALEMIEQLLNEGKTIRQLAGKIALNVFVHYPSTLDMHPYSVAHQIANLVPLVSGDAGKMAQLIPHDTALHITTFDGDIMSNSKAWNKILANHPNARVTMLPGAHSSIADPETLAFVLARLEAAQVAHADHGYVTGSEMYDAAHEYVEDILHAVLKDQYLEQAS